MPVPKHLKGLVKGKPLCKKGGWTVYEPSEAMKWWLGKKIRAIKAGRSKDVLLVLKNKKRRKR